MKKKAKKAQPKKKKTKRKPMMPRED